jgi:hypothetical protein
MEKVMNKRSTADMTASALQILSRIFATAFLPLRFIPVIAILCHAAGAAHRVQPHRIPRNFFRYAGCAGSTAGARKNLHRFCPKKGKTPRNPLQGAGLQVPLVLFF